MEVEPIRKMEDVKRMYQWLKENKTPREAECFLIGCNIALRAGDLLSLRFEQFDNDQEEVVIKEQKSGFRKEIPVLDVVKDSVSRLRDYYASKNFDPTYLFQSTSNRTKNMCQPICIQWLGKTFKDAEIGLNLGYNINTHSMRKTWGYQSYSTGTDIAYIQALLNHREQYTTLRYIGVTKDSIKKLLHTNQMDIASTN